MFQHFSIVCNRERIIQALTFPVLWIQSKEKKKSSSCSKELIILGVLLLLRGGCALDRFTTDALSRDRFSIFVNRVCHRRAVFPCSLQCKAVGNRVGPKPQILLRVVGAPRAVASCWQWIAFIGARVTITETTKENLVCVVP